MKFPESWLRTLVDPPLDSDALAERLTMSGLEVETLEPVAPPFSGVVIGRVTAVAAHPNADRLRVTLVDAGDGKPVNVVCGAPNVRPGMLAPFARAGAQLPGLTIALTQVRGVESHGMLCSAKELGLSNDAAGLLVLPEDAPVGAALREYLNLDDRLFTLKLTPNRADCLSVEGLAREVGAVTGTSAARVSVKPVPAVLQDRVAIDIAAPLACGRYCGRIVRGVNPAAVTPPWMAERLVRSGLRPVSAIVDVTNYVLLELGQPLHAFDLARLNGGIRVRWAGASESLALLNGETRTLNTHCLVIADEKKALALAGIMGGADSAVSDATSDILLESAFFAPDAIAGRGRELTLATDSSHRFERGVDFEGQARALERATTLILDICGGRPGPIAEARGELPARTPVTLRLARAQRLLGIDVPVATAAEMLARLGLSPQIQGDAIVLTPPAFRYDLAIEEDLIEEIARIHGYDRIPAQAPAGTQTMLRAGETARTADDVRHALARRDYQEIVSFSFVDAEWERDFCANEAPVALANPIASQMSVMRSSLIGSLVDRARFNLSRQQERIRLFEIGRCFVPAGEVTRQPLRVGGLASGPAAPPQWGIPSRSVDFYDVKSDLEALLAPLTIETRACRHPALHPGKSAEVIVGSTAIGVIGELHPGWAKKYDCPYATMVFEMDLALILERTLPTYAEVPRFPCVRRDIAVEVASQHQVSVILHTLKTRAPRLVSEVVLFDVFRGKGIDSDKKSLAFRVTMQDTARTLTDAEVEAAVATLLKVLHEEFGGRLRE
ncbi:MAG: phenylalanine--tRNA ligase subunit beta [Burkholderiales bacterium]